jgi:hypothetical protein
MPVDPSVAAIFAGQAQAPVQQPVYQQPAPAPQPVAAGVLPSGREPGRPMPGRKRRTKAEMAEDAAMGIGAALGEESEEDASLAPQQPAFGAPAPAPQPTYQQPPAQPQVAVGQTADAFAGWDD